MVSERFEYGRNFCNKLWNAARFAIMNLEGYTPGTVAEADLRLEDRWILSRLSRVSNEVTTLLGRYQFDQATRSIRDFTWNEFCDWYLELSKGTLYAEDDSAEAQAARQGARHTLWTCFHALSRLLHPVMPYLSETLWRELPHTEGTIALEAYPVAADFPEDDGALAEVAVLQEAITAVRRIKADMGLSPKVELALRGADVVALKKHASAMRDLAKVVDIAQGGREGICATAVVNGAELYIPLEGVIDIEAERDRLDKELQKSEKDISALEKRLGNQGFVAKAPVEVVQGFEEKLASARERRASLASARAQLG